MTLAYWLTAEAENELIDASKYYTKRASKFVAHAFIAEFKRAIGIVIQNPSIGSAATDGLRIFPLKRFPYSIIYEITPAGPLIYALAHQQRKPGYWLERIQ